MNTCFETSDILDFCFGAPNTPAQQALMNSMLTDPITLDTVRYIMSLKLQFNDRNTVENYLETSRKEALAQTMKKIKILYPE